MAKSKLMQDWLDKVIEAPIDPAYPVIDPHHHLWTDTLGRTPYLLADLWSDTGGGHRIEKTVFIECRAQYREDGPDHLKPIGETDFVARIARASRDGGGGAVIAGFVGHADLRLGSLLREVLAAVSRHPPCRRARPESAGAEHSRPCA